MQWRCIICFEKINTNKGESNLIISHHPCLICMDTLSIQALLLRSDKRDLILEFDYISEMVIGRQAQMHMD